MNSRPTTEARGGFRGVGIRRFAKQADAFSYADSFGGLPVFSREFEGRCGQREYFVSNWDCLYHWLSVDLNRDETLRGKRTQYELIRSGRPCHMYVDAEFMRELNPTIDPVLAWKELEERVVESIKTILANSKNSIIQRLHKDPKSRLEIEVNVLDASTEKKESKHFCFRIFYHTEGGRITPVMFAENKHCQYLMLNLEAHIVASLEKGESITTRKPTTLIVKGHENGKDVELLYPDMNVYTRERNFRMPWCTKAGQARPLLPLVNCNGKWIKLPADKLSRKYFFKNLVTYQPQGEGMAPVVHLEVPPSPYHVKRTIELFRAQMVQLSSLAAGVGDRIRGNPFQGCGTGIGSSSGVWLLPEGVEDEGPSSARKCIPLNQTRSDAPPARLVNIVHRLLPREEFYCWREFLDSGVVQVSTKSRMCNSCGYEHRSNHVRYKLFTGSGTWMQYCYHGGSRTTVLPVDDDIREEMKLYFKQDRSQVETDCDKLFSTTLGTVLIAQDEILLRSFLSEAEERLEQDKLRPPSPSTTTTDDNADEEEEICKRIRLES